MPASAGLKVFDYGRSKKDTGPYAFKKNWGFEPQPLHYEYCLYKRDSIPQNNPANPKYRLFIAAWRKLPLGAGECARAAHREVSGVTRDDGQHPLPRPPPAVSAQQGRQGPLVPSAQAPGGAAPGLSRHVHRRSRRRPTRRRAATAVRRPARRAAGPARCANPQSLRAAARRGADAAVLPQREPRRLGRGHRRDQRPDAAVVFSSAMAQYVPAELGLRTLVDLVDVDSAKWTQYAGNHRWPLSWLYAREGRKLLEFERATVRRAAHSFLVTDAEVELFVGQAPECAGRVDAVGNGVDSEFFSPDHGFASPFDATKSRSCSPVRWTIGRTSTP